MGVHANPSKMMVIPTYLVHAAVEEDVGGGNILIRHYQRKNGILIPQYDVVMDSADLFNVSRRINDFAQSVFNAEQLRIPGQHVH